jgi:hypothetical protein
MPDEPQVHREAGTPRPVGELISLLIRDERADEAVARELLGHFDARSTSPESFGQLLEQQGLDSQWALALTQLLNCEQARREFLKREQPISLDAALDLRWWDTVRKEITWILSPDRARESKQSEGIFRNLCRLAIKFGIDPEAFRRLLVASELTDSRASEVKRVLECAPARDAFVAKTNCIPWQQALDQSRQLGQSQEEQRMHELTRLSRQLVRLVVRRMENHAGKKLKLAKFSLLRTGQECFDLVAEGEGTFHLEFNPSLALP